VERVALMGEPALFLDGKVRLHCGDCLDVLAAMPENSVDSVVCDPPYHLTSIVKRFGAEGAAEAKGGSTGAYQRASSGFMGKQWDGGDIAFQPATWAAVLRVLKPGGYLLAFASTRGFGRMSVAIEDAGFTTHPLIAWVFGSGFPKATRIKADGYDGFRYGGQALKPAIEPIYMGQKPFSEANGTANILLHGTGALNIDACRIVGESTTRKRTDNDFGIVNDDGWAPTPGTNGSQLGRWPANLIHDGSDEVLAAFPHTKSGLLATHHKMAESENGSMSGKNYARSPNQDSFGDEGSAARFFYTAKADSEDRLGSKHPTVKPLDLMQYLCRLVTPPGGTILDPFAGTGTTGEAAWREGFRAILIEREAEYQADIARRMDLVLKPTERSAVAKGKGKLQGAEGTPLFGGLSEIAGGGTAGRSTATSPIRTDDWPDRSQAMNEAAE
jgi:site-specific DNA-methyltransferase (adenine-specific)